MMFHRSSRLTRVILLSLTLFLSLVLVAQTMGKRGSVFEQLDLLVDIRHEIVSEYVEEPNQQKMTEAAARAMVESLDDPFTVYLTPEELEPFDKQVRGTFSGIGAEVDIHDNQLRIVTPLDDSPAFKAGVLAGDIVLEIDGQPLSELFAKLETDNLKLREAIKRLTGPEGKPVTVKVRHSSGEETAIVIIRAQINVQTVRGYRRSADAHWDYMLSPEHRIGFIRLSQFTDKTAADLKAALEQLRQQQVRGLILDMRFNPGGLLESAVEVSDMFLPAGKRIVSVKGRATRERVFTSTDASSELDGIPLVVMANEASASAAEIVTGALADNDRALFIGTRTFGKGSVQQVRMLESGQGAIKITNAYYYIPSGRNIHRRKDAEVWGVDPKDGFYVTMSVDQIKQMTRIRRDGDVLKANGDKAVENPITPQRIEKEWSDPQLAASLKALLGKLESGQWPKVGESGAADLARLATRASLERQREQLSERLTRIDQELAKLNASTTQPATQPATVPGK